MSMLQNLINNFSYLECAEITDLNTAVVIKKK